MMDFITMPVTCLIVFGAIYAIFDLFVRRKERLAIIEKMSEKIDTSLFENKIGCLNNINKSSFGALKIGCLLSGIGLGLLIGYFINLCGPEYNEWHKQQEIQGVVYGASVLLCGGIGLIIAFITEQKLSQKQH